MKKAIMTLVALCSLALLVSVGCAGKQPDPNAGRWEPYGGCNEQQCRSWGSACEADCLNAKTNSQQCINQCGLKVDRCKEQCQ